MITANRTELISVACKGEYSFLKKIPDSYGMLLVPFRDGKEQVKKLCDKRDEAFALIQTLPAPAAASAKPDMPKAR
jgi:hypothetical protein